MKGIILTGGSGTWLHPITQSKLQIAWQKGRSALNASFKLN